MARRKVATATKADKADASQTPDNHIRPSVYDVAVGSLADVVGRAFHLCAEAERLGSVAFKAGELANDQRLSMDEQMAEAIRRNTARDQETAAWTTAYALQEAIAPFIKPRDTADLFAALATIMEIAARAETEIEDWDRDAALRFVQRIYGLARASFPALETVSGQQAPDWMKDRLSLSDD